MNSTLRMYLAAGAALGAVMLAVRTAGADRQARSQRAAARRAFPGARDAGRSEGDPPAEPARPEPSIVPGGAAVRQYTGLKIEVVGAGQSPFTPGRGARPAGAREGSGSRSGHQLRHQ